MGILVSQLPPAELARLKAELAETLISNFCYPRFYDYRTDSLRMRPVDRTKRQEVWQYLGSVDFNAWGRIDLMSPDFQHQIERLFIYFVQRNRTFFGEQGRKRMADIRMLISTSSISIVEGLRGHLTGRSNAFGNPRPVSSWVNSNVTRRPEPTWEQLVAPTMLLQQQLQELRGEIKTAVNDVRPNGTSPKHSLRDRSAINGSSAGEHEIMSKRTTSTSTPSPQAEAHTSTPVEHPKITNPLTSPVSLDAQSVSSASVYTPVSKIEQVIIIDETLTPSIQESTTVLVSEEDVVIFEQMRHQLVIWTRVEAVRAGIDIAGHEPAELVELLQQFDGLDETRLQVTSTLLNLCDQIITAGNASLLEYKQAVMFYLMHTRSAR